MKTEDAVRIGAEFRKVCLTEGFAYAVEALQKEYQSIVFGSDVGDSKRREEAYLQARALDELIITINTFITIAESELLEVDPDEDTIFE